MDGLRCLGRTPGYVRYSGYDTAKEEARYLPVLGPVWKYGDPVPPAARAGRLEEKTPPSRGWSLVIRSQTDDHPHLVTLNPEQRHAVEHGVRPLLINAGQVRERQRRSPTAWPI